MLVLELLILRIEFTEELLVVILEFVVVGVVLLRREVQEIGRDALLCVVELLTCYSFAGLLLALLCIRLIIFRSLPWIRLSLGCIGSLGFRRDQSLGIGLVCIAVCLIL